MINWINVYGINKLPANIMIWDNGKEINYIAYLDGKITNYVFSVDTIDAVMDTYSI